MIDDIIVTKKDVIAFLLKKMSFDSVPVLTMERSVVFFNLLFDNINLFMAVKFIIEDDNQKVSLKLDRIISIVKKFISNPRYLYIILRYALCVLRSLGFKFKHARKTLMICAYYKIKHTSSCHLIVNTEEINAILNGEKVCFNSYQKKRNKK